MSRSTLDLSLWSPDSVGKMNTYHIETAISAHWIAPTCLNLGSSYSWEEEDCCPIESVFISTLKGSLWHPIFCHGLPSAQKLRCPCAASTCWGGKGCGSLFHPFESAYWEDWLLPRQDMICARQCGKLVKGRKNGKCSLLFLFNFRNWSS